MIVDLGCGLDEERWISGDFKLDDDITTEGAKELNILRVDVTQGLPFKDATVDEIFARNSISYMMEDLRAVFAEALRVLKPQGRLTIIEHIPVNDAARLLEHQWITEERTPWMLSRTDCIVQAEDMGDGEIYLHLFLMYQKYPISRYSD